MNNSQSSKPLIICIVILVLAILGWWYFKTPQAPVQPASTQQAAPTQTAQNTSDISNPSDVSDAALNQDFTVIDAQMSSLNTDVTNANTVQ
jgi:predicted negative regulator of RcsB-dependent stress response